MNPISIKNMIDATCVCGATVRVGELVGADEYTPVAVHTVPPCQTFVEQDPFEFLATIKFWTKHKEALQ